MARPQIGVVGAATVDQTRKISSKSETNLRPPTLTTAKQQIGAADVATMDRTRSISLKSETNLKPLTETPVRLSRWHPEPNCHAPTSRWWPMRTSYCTSIYSLQLRQWLQWLRRPLCRLEWILKTQSQRQDPWSKTRRSLSSPRNWRNWRLKKIDFNQRHHSKKTEHKATNYYHRTVKFQLTFNFVNE